MSPIQSQDSQNALYVILQFDIIKAQNGEIVRDRGSNMSNMVNNQKAKA